MITGGGRNDYWRREGGLLGEGGLNTVGRRVYYWRWQDNLEREGHFWRKVGYCGKDGRLLKRGGLIT